MRPLIASLMALVAVCCVVSVAGASKPRLDISGGGSLTFRLDSVGGAGGQQAYGSQYWDTGPFDHQAQVNVSGSILDRVFLEGRLSSGRFSRSASDFTLRIDASGSDVSIGSIRADLGSNPFVSFTRQLNGVAFKGGKAGDRLSYSAFVSRSKGSRRSETFPGNDTPGPYLLRYTPILDGSETVKVDEQLKQRGVDYTLDYYSGVLSFEVGFGPQAITTNIPSTSTISISYEQARGGSQEGALYGFATRAKAGKDLSLDAAYLARIPAYQPATQETSIKRTEEFYGAGSPGPFYLTYRPIDETQPMAVYVDSTLMHEGENYTFDRLNMAIEFFTIISYVSIVRVEYYQLQEATQVSEALNVIGLGGNLALNENTSLRLDLARSVRGGTLAGSALGLRAESHLGDGKANLSGGFRTVSPSFSSVSGVGSDRQSAGFDFSGDLKAGKFVSISALLSRDRSNTGLNFGYGGGYGSGSDATSGGSSYAVGTGRQSLDVTFTFPNLPRITLQRTVMSNSSQGGGAEMANHSLALSYARGEFTTSARFVLGNQRLSSAAGSGEQAITTTAFKSAARNFTLSWLPSQRFNLSCGLSSNASHGASGATSANSMDLSLTHYLTSALTLTARRSLSTSNGQISSSSDYGSFPNVLSGSGTISSDTLSGRQAATAGSSPSYRNVIGAYGISYAPGSDFSASLFINERDYLDVGSGYSTARSAQDATLSLNKSVGKFIRANANLATQRTSYGGTSAADSRGKSLGLNFAFHPVGSGNFSLGYRSDVYRSIGIGATETPTTTSLSSLLAEYGYSFRNGHSLSSQATLTSGDGGLDRYRRLVWTTEYAIPINDLFSASMMLTHRSNKTLGSADAPVSSGADYSAFSFTAQLSARFQ